VIVEEAVDRVLSVKQARVKDNTSMCCRSEKAESLCNALLNNINIVITKRETTTRMIPQDD
jgi:hypothetical protein